MFVCVYMYVMRSKECMEARAISILLYANRSILIALISISE